MTVCILKNDLPHRVSHSSKDIPYPLVGPTKKYALFFVPSGGCGNGIENVQQLFYPIKYNNRKYYTFAKGIIRWQEF